MRPSLAPLFTVFGVFRVLQRDELERATLTATQPVIRQRQHCVVRDLNLLSGVPLLRSKVDAFGEHGGSAMLCDSIVALLGVLGQQP